VALEPFVPAKHLAEDDPEKFLQALAGIDAEMAARVQALKAEGKSLRYLARIEPEAAGPKITVAPVGVDAMHPAAALRGSEAFVAFHTERYKQYPLVVRGAGRRRRRHRRRRPRRHPPPRAESPQPVTDRSGAPGQAERLESAAAPNPVAIPFARPGRISNVRS
jgi:hypothetical protein